MMKTYFQDLKRPKKETTTILIKGIPVEIKRHFKAWCNLHGVSMQGTLIDFMERTVLEEEAIL